MLVALVTLLGCCYFALQNSWVQTQITKKIAVHLSKRLNTTISVGKVDIGYFNTLYLEDVLIEDLNHDTLFFSQLITAKIDTIKIRKQRLSIDELVFKNNTLNIARDSANSYNFNFILNSFNSGKERDNPNLWEINCNRFDFGQLNIAYHGIGSNNDKYLFVSDLNLDISDFHSKADSLSFQVNQLSLNDGHNLNLQSTKADVVINNGKVEVSDFYLKSSHSLIENTNLEFQLYSASDSMNTPFDMNLRIEKSVLSFREIGELVPTFKGMNQELELSGLIYGNLSDLKGKNVVLSTGTETTAILDFYINDLSTPENMYLFLDLKQSETSFTDVSNIRFPDKAKRRYLDFPESFHEAGRLKFKGNFSGFLSDFVTFGTLESEMGSLTTDIMVAPEKGGTIYYRGNVSTTNFKLGQLFKLERLGNLTFSGSADGNFDKTSQAISGVFKGDITQIEINNYNYKNILFDGILVNKMFDGLLSINDPNLQFNFLGELDLNTEIPRFDFNMNLKRALPSKLHLGKNFPDAEIAFKMDANFDGNRIDNLNGAIVVKEGYYKNRNGEFNLQGMELKTIPQLNENALLFTSDFFDVSINGKYNFRSIVSSFQKIIHHYIPSSNFEFTNAEDSNNFEYRFNVNELNELSKVFIPDLEFETPFLLYGKIDSPNNDFQFNGSIPGIKYKNIWARNIFIGNQNIGNQYSSKFRIGEILHRNGMELYNFTIDSKVSDNRLKNLISWSNFDELTYSGAIRTETQFSRSDTTNQLHVEIKGLPSQIYVADTLWSITPFTAIFDSSSLQIMDFSIVHINQEFAANGKIVGGKTDRLNIDLKNIDLSYFDKYFEQDIKLEGITNGSFSISNAFNEPVILSDLKIDNLRYKKQFMGDISLLSKWNHLNSTIDSELKIIRNGRQNLKAFGYLKPSTKELKYFAEADSLSLMVLDVFMRKNFSEIKGHGTGKVEIGGKPDNLTFNGSVLCENAGLKINVTQIPYSFSDSIHFKNDTIHFDNISIFDDLNNQGKFDGTIVHRNFNHMLFDLHFSSDRIKALNTTSRNNDQFYGTAIARGRFDITGFVTDTKLTGTATTLPGTEVNISMESESEIEEYDFIEFVSTTESKTNDFFQEAIQAKRGEYDLSFTIEATPDAKVQLIYNSQIGDVIKAQGEGILLFEMDEEGNMSLSGNYTPTKGDYLFTLQNVINKRFTIEPGGSIVWSGDPYNAIIDLKAIYKLRASVYELLNNYDNLSQNQRIQVECIIELEDELANPTIGFDINFPTTDERTKDDLQQFFNTNEEMNKQILSLIVMGKFYIPDYMRGTLEAQNTNMIGTTASEMFSNQLSNWLSQISSNWDVGFNYRPGNQVSDDEIEFALSTQIFNDRVTLDGNIGNNTNQYTNNSSQIVGDFEMGVKLVPSGKIEFKAYNRSNNNLIYVTGPYTQGIGLSFKEEYNSIDELFQKLTKIFRKKK